MGKTTKIVLMLLITFLMLVVTAICTEYVFITIIATVVGLITYVILINEIIKEI